MTLQTLQTRTLLPVITLTSPPFMAEGGPDNPSEEGAQNEGTYTFQISLCFELHESKIPVISFTGGGDTVGYIPRRRRLVADTRQSA